MGALLAFKTPATGSSLNWQDLRGRIGIAKVVTALLGPAAKRHGRLLWPCPFHEDRHPSFEVDPQGGTWRCWPCDLRGDAPALVMRRHGVAFPEAVRVVAELSGIVTGSGRPVSPPPRPATASKPEKSASPPPERSSGLPPARCPGSRD